MLALSICILRSLKVSSHTAWMHAQGGYTTSYQYITAVIVIIKLFVTHATGGQCFEHFTHNLRLYGIIYTLRAVDPAAYLPRGQVY